MTWIRRGFRDMGRGLVLYWLSVVATVLSLTVTLDVSLITVGLGIVCGPALITRVRRLADRERSLAATWSGVEIPQPYEPDPPPGTPVHKRSFAIVSDPATWRDLVWLVFEPLVGPIAALPAVLFVFGLGGLAAPFAWRWWQDIAHGDTNWYYFIPLTGTVTAWLSFLLGLGQLVLALWLAPRMILLHTRFVAAWLSPSRVHVLTDRLNKVRRTRSDAMSAQAAELRRIERDLHDGAQTRLVATGMTLYAAEKLLKDEPEAARALLEEARETTNAALQEIRDLVRGVLPPVLADRGLGDAVRSLALTCPIRTEVVIELSGELEPAMESAVYFAVSEILANAAKHSMASQVWIDIRHDHQALCVSVTDNGRGGATTGEAEDAGGLAGIERRIGAFDGVLAISSPLGGPTTVTMELPYSPP